MKFYTNVSQYGNFVLERGIENGEPFKNKIEYAPTLFIPSKEKSKYKTLSGQSVSKMKFGNIADAKEFMNKYDTVENFEIYGYTSWMYCYLSDEYPKTITYDFNHIKIMYIDIEVASEHGFPKPEEAKEEITAISMKCGKDFVVIGCGDYNNTREDIKYIKCESEEELIHAFIEHWKRISPDIITGWNIKFFDIPYIVNRITKLFGEKFTRQLSPWNFVRESKVMGLGGKYHQTYNLTGISVLDYLDLYKKFTLVNQESYRLDHIAHVELGEAKLDYSEFDTLHQLYKLDHQKFINYNIKDVELIEQIEEKKKLVEQAVVLAYDGKTNYDDVFKQVRMWDILTFNYLRQKDIVVPQKERKFKDRAYAGAYVKDPQIGRHDWVVSFDLNSLYPHLIMQYNISPETLITGDLPADIQKLKSEITVENLLNRKLDSSILKKYNLCMAANGHFFRRDIHGFLPEMMQNMYDDRVQYKKQMIDALIEYEKNKTKSVSNRVDKFKNLQSAKKVSLNSAYGALGNQYFRFYDIRQAEAVTKSGQLTIQWIERDVNNFLNKLLKTDNEDYVIASDTDSIYVVLDKLVNNVFKDVIDKEKVINFLDKVCEGKIQKVINESFQNLFEYMNAYEQKMFMKREGLSDKGIWTSKKRYMLNVYDNEGVRYKEPKIKMMGIEAVKSSTPSACRDKLRDAISIIMNKDESTLLDFIEEFKGNFKNLPIEEISFPRSVQGVNKYYDSNQLYKKGTPLHIRGAIIYNDMIHKNSLGRKYQVIQEGEKIKYTYLKVPNPTTANVIAMLNTFPKEFKLEKYIDYDLQFTKSFLDPLKIILDTIGWETERKSTLENFF
jgi:DNA polymerase elongation subunit (family B)